jgi:molecular chaperone HtpG
MTKKAHLSIHSENILPIIKKWLYSEKEIFLRELVSNATDAIQKRKILQSESQASPSQEPFRIDIAIDQQRKTLTISDNGLGMSEEEVEKYIAQIAFSGAQEFIEKYQTEESSMIGHFGLGFYSSYMVADKVEIQTLSYKENAKPVSWECDGSSEYLLDTGYRDKVGSDIILFINKENEEFLDAPLLQKLLKRFSPYLPFPIYLNNTQINQTSPLWIKNPSDISEKEAIDFYRELYPFEADPVFWLSIHIDFPFRVNGVLYFPKITSQFDFSKSCLKLFCNRVFVSDNCKDLLPDYLSILRGAIDSPDIPLNVSRSYLQMDKNVRQLSSHIAKKIADHLLSLYQTDKERFISQWKDLEMIIKLGILQDEKFYERVKDFLIWKTSLGEWVTLDQILTENKKIFYTQQEKSPILDLYHQKKIPILQINQHIDTALISLLERKSDLSFQRIDGAIDDSVLDSSREKNLLDPEGKSESSKIADFIRSALSMPDLEIEAKSLASDELPSFILLKEEERRMRDYMQLTQNAQKEFFPKKTFVVNTNNNLIIKALQLKSSHPNLATSLIQHLYQLSLLSQKELTPEQLQEFSTSSSKLLTELTSFCNS